MRWNKLRIDRSSEESEVMLDNGSDGAQKAHI
jgi:hypothetical protein